MHQILVRATSVYHSKHPLFSTSRDPRADMRACTRLCRDCGLYIHRKVFYILLFPISRKSFDISFRYLEDFKPGRIAKRLRFSFFSGRRFRSSHHATAGNKHQRQFKSFALVYNKTVNIYIPKSFPKILLIQIRVVLQSDLRKLPQDSGIKDQTNLLFDHPNITTRFFEYY